jgi:hypothetical protein
VAHEAVAIVATRLVLEFCGAVLGAPQKFGILWRTLFSAPQNLRLLWRTIDRAPQNLAPDFVAHYISMRHRIFISFYGALPLHAPQNVNFWIFEFFPFLQYILVFDRKYTGNT